MSLCYGVSEYRDEYHHLLPPIRLQHDAQTLGMYGDLPLLYCACICGYIGVAISLANQHSSLWNIGIAKCICQLLALFSSTINYRLLGGVYIYIYLHLHHRPGSRQHYAAITATCVRVCKEFVCPYTSCSDCCIVLCWSSRWWWL